MAATLVIHTKESRETAHSWISGAPWGTVVTFKRPGRTVPQNDRMWAMLTKIAQKAVHNGRRYTPDQWKCLFMHACGHEIMLMDGLNGEAFPAGFRSSNLNKEQMNDLMAFIEKWAAENGVYTGEG
ncbi:MAG: recombination protein NinB [Pseudomonadota bacterium]